MEETQAPRETRPRPVRFQSYIQPMAVLLVTSVGFFVGTSFLQENVLHGEIDSPPEQWYWMEDVQGDWDKVEVYSPKSLKPLAAQGKALYTKYCADCHGENGDGAGLLASSLPVQPRNFTKEWFRYRTVDGSGHARPGDLYRTITVGVKASGMPSYDHLSPQDRWALVSWVTTLSTTFTNAAGLGRPIPKLTLPAEDGGSVERGKKVYKRLQCAKCHGDSLLGDGISAAELKDDIGRPIKVPVLAKGFHVYKAGGYAQSLARFFIAGLAGTPMPSFRSSFRSLKGDDLRKLADLVYYVRSVSRKGAAARKRQWSSFFEGQGSWSPVKGERPGDQQKRWESKTRSKNQISEGIGCLSCHDGIAPISSGTMARALFAFGAGNGDRQCVVCHEGNPKTDNKLIAHANMVMNPGNLWVTSIGLGCAKCHSDQGVLKTLHGRPLPEGVGGQLMSVVSKQSDPTGLSGSNHAYRMQRGLMALEMGKVTHAMRSAGLLGLDAFLYADFAIDDTDGEVPSSGTKTYKEFIKRAREEGHLHQMSSAKRIPNYDEALAMCDPKKPAAAGYVDYYRKECGRCHLWGEGITSRGQHRSAGCSACHISYGPMARYRGKDPTIPKSRPGHMKKHSLVFAPPIETCNHCHTRGQQTYRHELHTKAGMICADCHTSIEVHGDGNLYPTIPYQMEVRCEDCHGTKSAYPWELPIGYGTGTKFKGKRGVHKEGDTEHLLTSRGNPRVNWTRRGNRVLIESLDKSNLFSPKLLKNMSLREEAKKKAAKKAKKPAKVFAKFRDPSQNHCDRHMQGLECFACHNSKAPSCISCHVTYFRQDFDIDFVQTGLRFNPKTGRQTVTETPGDVVSQQRYSQPAIWKPGEMRKNKHGKLAPFVKGCDVTFEHYSDGMKKRDLLDIPTNPGRGKYPTGLGPTMAHEWETPVRKCVDCHIDPDKPDKK
ncbi:MAG: c-type cytochrome [Planctomycetota bacterium]|nr:c-type cytochrome [Planctomycetota bacterium]